MAVQIRGKRNGFKFLTIKAPTTIAENTVHWFLALKGFIIDNVCFNEECAFYSETNANLFCSGLIEPRREKTSLQGFRPGLTKPGCTATEDS